LAEEERLKQLTIFKQRQEALKQRWQEKEDARLKRLESYMQLREERERERAEKYEEFLKMK
jgi:membrane protein involved in colicin uptake